MFRMALWNYTTLTDVAGPRHPKVPPGVEASPLGCRLTPRQKGPQRVAKIGGGMSSMQPVSGAEVGFSIQAFRMFR